MHKYSASQLNGKLSAIKIVEFLFIEASFTRTANAHRFYTV